MTMIATVLMRMRMIILKRMMTVDNCRSWDAVKGVALDQTTDHADYVQVQYKQQNLHRYNRMIQVQNYIIMRK